MYLHRLTAIVFAFLLSAPLFAQRKPRIKGSRNPVIVAESLPPFTGIELQDDLEVRLIGGRQSGYELEVDDNLVDVLRFEVRDSTLYISTFYTITASKALYIAVSFPELTAVRARHGRLFSETRINADVIDLLAGEDAKLDLRVQASLCRVLLSENASADLNVESDSLSVILRDRSAAKLYASHEGMQLQMEGNTGLFLEGIGTRLKAEVAGNSNLKASRMEINHLTVAAAGFARVEARAMDDCILDLTARSRLFLYGAPAITLNAFSDRAELHKEPD